MLALSNDHTPLCVCGTVNVAVKLNVVLTACTVPEGAPVIVTPGASSATETLPVKLAVS